MKTLPFHSEHLKVMDMRPYEWEKIYPFLPQETLDYWSSLGHAYTLMKDGKIITCIGWIPLWDGVWEIWQIPSIHVAENPIDYVRTLKDFITSYTRKLKAHRVQSHCPADPLHDRWMVFMEFEQEGTLSGYSRFKEDYRLWSRRFTWEQ